MPTPTRAKRRIRRIAARRPSETRILVAAAGDRESRGALRLAAELAKRDAASVMLLGVATPFPHNLSTFVSMRQPVAIDEVGRLAVLEDVQKSVQDLPGAERWAKRAVIGFPADAIVDMASAWRASIILLGIGRHGRIKRMFGTETAVGVMRRARVPVLAVHPNATTLPGHVVAAVDFTEASKASAALAGRLLAADGTLTLAHVCAFGGVVPKEGDLVDLYRTGAQARLDELVHSLRHVTKRRVEGVMLSGEPGDALLGFARRTNCELIALGGHEQGLMDRILLGSVRTQVVRGARCSVLMAPPETKPQRRGGK
jgi:nucleotide-binding universal stress UspA family protein